MPAQRSIMLILLLLCFTRAFPAGATDFPEPFFIDSLTKELAKPLSDSVRVDVLHELAIGLKGENSAKALEYIHDAIAIASQMDNTYRKGRSIDIKGLVYRTQGLYDKALSCHLQALQLYKGLSRAERWNAYALTNMAIVYIEFKRYEAARKTIAYAIKLVENVKDYPADTLWKYTYLCTGYSNMGAILGYMGNIKASLMYFHKSLATAIRISNRTSMALAYGNIGESYRLLKQDMLAERYIRKAIQLSSAARDFAFYYNAMAEICEQSGKYEEAEKYALEVLRLAERVDFNIAIATLKTLSGLYERKGDHKKALNYYKRFHDLNDSTINIASVKQLNTLQTQYESEAKDNEILLLNQHKQLIEATAEKDKAVRNLIIILLAFAIVVSAVVGRNFVLKQRIAHRTLSEKTALIEKSNAELIKDNTEAKYELLKSKINPHFLFNSLSTLSSLVRESEELALKYIQSFSSLYRSILETSEVKLFELRNEIKIVEHYLLLQQMEYEDNLIVNIRIPSKVETCLMPPFSIQMAVENAIKHNIITSKDKLFINIYVEEEAIVIENSFQKKTIKPVSTKTGQKNIEERYKIISDNRPVFEQVDKLYRVRLPLLEAIKKNI